MLYRVVQFMNLRKRKGKMPEVGEEAHEMLRLRSEIPENSLNSVQIQKSRWNTFEFKIYYLIIGMAFVVVFKEAIEMSSGMHFYFCDF